MSSSAKTEKRAVEKTIVLPVSEVFIQNLVSLRRLYDLTNSGTLSTNTQLRIGNQISSLWNNFTTEFDDIHDSEVNNAIETYGDEFDGDRYLKPNQQYYLKNQISSNRSLITKVKQIFAVLRDVKISSEEETGWILYISIIGQNNVDIDIAYVLGISLVLRNETQVIIDDYSMLDIILTEPTEPFSNLNRRLLTQQEIIVTLLFQNLNNSGR